MYMSNKSKDQMAQQGHIEQAELEAEWRVWTYKSNTR